MTAIAPVLLVLGFLFATLFFPAPMRRFWKWALIGVGSAILVAVVIMAAVILNEPKPNNTKAQNVFDQFDGKPNDWFSPDAKLPDDVIWPESSKPEDAFEKSLKSMHPRVAEWARRHKEDLSNPERLKAALAADKEAIKLGCAPGSDCYMGALNLNMGYSNVLHLGPPKP